MDSLYLISLIVGGFFVLLSIFGVGDQDADVDADHDLDLGSDHEHDLGGDADHDLGAGVGLIDLFSIRALFLFAAFFGLTGTLLTLLGRAEPLTAIASTLVGLIVGLGGNYAIKRFAYRSVSSGVDLVDYQGKTARVILPFDGSDRGKILLEVKGKRLQLLARSLDLDSADQFAEGEEVVVIRMDGRTAEVVKPT